jgi:CHASE2 domain-containing sensor protein
MQQGAQQSGGNQETPESLRRKRRTAWFIGAAIVVVGALIAAYEMFVVGTPAPTFVELIVLIGVPGIYLALMYLSLTRK